MSLKTEKLTNIIALFTIVAYQDSNLKNESESLRYLSVVYKCKTVQLMKQHKAGVPKEWVPLSGYVHTNRAFCYFQQIMITI